MIRYLDDIIIVICLLSLIGCATFPDKSTAYIPPLPANLAQPCEDFEAISSTQSDVVYRWVVKSTYTHVSCATLHQSTVDFYNMVRKTNNGL